ncbi:hypothetical protein FOMPIDRAFT_117771 [Fomitopsis schrenkii]|uniref:RING-type domain-containing protein n=1 Tax=Fomitopsis schrenkii TaxID=2126942 RepID=S8DHN6_FOMSC|nr:hypothetical protein FOMPIDRAFT_117771 [Fomitopsis schrenkii]
MSATSAPSGSSGAKASNGPGRQGRKRPRLQPTAKRSTSPVIEISSDDEQISVALYQKRSTVSRTAIEGDPQPLGSSTTAHVREVFEAACEANIALRQEHQREVKRLENDLRTAAEKVATLQREVSAATSSEKESQRERDAVYDTLAALQQELEAAHVAYDQAAEELRVAEDKGARIEEELRHAHSAIGDLQKQITDINEHSMSVEVLEDVTAQLEELKGTDSRARDFFSQMEDAISCAICTRVFREPYALSCGHTFCQTCLEAYLDTKLARHIEDYPDFAGQIQELTHYRQVLQQNDEAGGMRQQLLGELAAMEAALPRPEFICPACRSRVVSRPSQEIALRHASELISTYLGERGPEQGHGPVQRGDRVWDRFFGML